MVGMMLWIISSRMVMGIALIGEMKMGKFKDLTGLKFGRLTVIEQHGFTEKINMVVNKQSNCNKMPLPRQYVTDINVGSRKRVRNNMSYNYPTERDKAFIELVKNDNIKP